MFLVPNTAETLCSMLAYTRPAGSDHETRFIDEWILPVLSRYATWETDLVGNLYAIVNDDTRIAFCAHTDTVNSRTSKIASVLSVDTDGFVTNANGGILGADDTTGIFILLQLIQNQVPGLYCFFRAEEVGGVGSGHAAKFEANRFCKTEIAISFDRKGYSSVITHQSTGRCCSNKFAVAFATQLNAGVTNDRYAYAPDDTGVFTDTANLTHLVNECTNVSVGYFSEHTPREKQDLNFAVDLVTRLLAVDWDSLPVLRDTSESYDDQDFKSSDPFYYSDDLFDTSKYSSSRYAYPAYADDDDDYSYIDDEDWLEPTDADLDICGITREEYIRSGLTVSDLIYCLDHGIDVSSYVWETTSTAKYRNRRKK